MVYASKVMCSLICIIYYITPKHQTMHTIHKLILSISILTGITALIASTHRNTAQVVKPIAATSNTIPKIQVAILLDVSSSMDGLIDQAKAQLWNMVSVLGRAKCGTAQPTIEIALYEYGRSTNQVSNGYIQQLNGFITSLDSVSDNLFKLTTNGGDEYCGQVIYKSINDLQWDAQANSYKVIFIAGNEDFLQGKIQYTAACNLAKTKGIIVNTIYCGPKLQGIKEHWNLGAECGAGSFTCISTNATIDEPTTPQDSAIYVLNSTLNNTYVTYNSAAPAAQAKQVRMDAANATLSKSAGIKRVLAKGKSNVYRNDDWDLVDAYAKDKNILRTMDKKALPDSLKNKTTTEIETVIIQQQAQRNAVQAELDALAKKRTAYLKEQILNKANGTTDANLEQEIEKIIKNQMLRFNMKID